MPTSSGGPTAAIHTHGCKLNQSDSEVLARRFTEAGYLVVDWATGAARADVLVLNSCTVTATADSKARQTLRAAHRANGNALIVATGCYAERAADQLVQLDGVSLVVGNAGKDQLVATVTEALAQRGEQPIPRPTPSDLQVDRPVETGPSSATTLRPNPGRSRAMIKIQEGCNQVCAYCIVPSVRGRERSVAPETVLREINDRMDQGCREVVLTGTQLGTYGFDIPGANLPNLLRLILRESAIPRLRVSSLQAQEISAELLELWRDPRLCPHFHLPLQSGSDRILQAMRRRYDTAQFARTVDLIRGTFPDAGVTTDLIVGFPGEGDVEHQESQRFARSMEFSGTHIFPYSPRPGTSAAYLRRQGVPIPATQDQVKKDRAAAMSEIAEAGFKRFRLRQIGTTRPVLWESAHGGDAPVWSGLTDNYIRVSTQDRRELGNVVTRVRLLELAADRVVSRAL